MIDGLASGVSILVQYSNSTETYAGDIHVRYMSLSITR